MIYLFVEDKYVFNRNPGRRICPTPFSRRIQMLDIPNMTVKEMIKLLQGLDPEAQLKVWSSRCPGHCDMASCPDSASRPQLTCFEPGDRYGFDNVRVYVIKPYAWKGCGPQPDVKMSKTSPPHPLIGK